MTKKTRWLWNHLLLPGVCRICGERNYYWLDGTYGCAKGHVYAKCDPTKDYALWEWVAPRGL